MTVKHFVVTGCKNKVMRQTASLLLPTEELEVAAWRVKAVKGAARAEIQLWNMTVCPYVKPKTKYPATVISRADGDHMG